MITRVFFYKNVCFYFNIKLQAYCITCVLNYIHITARRFCSSLQPCTASCTSLRADTLQSSSNLSTFQWLLRAAITILWSNTRISMTAAFLSKLWYMQWHSTSSKIIVSDQNEPLRLVTSIRPVNTLSVTLHMVTKNRQEYMPLAFSWSLSNSLTFPGFPGWWASQSLCTAVPFAAAHT